MIQEIEQNGLYNCETLLQHLKRIGVITNNGSLEEMIRDIDNYLRLEVMRLWSNLKKSEKFNQFFVFWIIEKNEKFSQESETRIKREKRRKLEACSCILPWYR